MSKTVKLRKGFDINLVGKAAKEMVEFAPAQTFAVKPTDFVGLQRPKVLVNEGDTVKAGTPIFFDKAMEQVKFVAPVSGEIIEVKRGEKRKLLEIRILADKEIAYEDLGRIDLSKIDRETLVDRLAHGGVWPHIIQRPFGVIANPADEPKAIYVSAFDTNPLSPDMAFRASRTRSLFPGWSRCFDQID